MELNYNELNKLVNDYGFNRRPFQLNLEDCTNLAEWLDSFNWSLTENGHDFWKKIHVKIYYAQQWSEDQKTVTNLPEVFNLLKRELVNTKYVIEKPKCYEI